MAALLAFTSTDDPTNSLSSEELIAYEIGIREEYFDSFSLDVSAFINDYDGVVASIADTSGFSTAPVAHVSLPQYFQNSFDGKTHGVEVATSWNGFETVLISAGYSWFENKLENDSGDKFTQAMPENIFNIRAYVDLTNSLEFDTALYYVDRSSGLQAPSYFRLDTRFGYSLNRHWELSLTGQDLLDDSHNEANPAGFDGAAFLGRRGYLQLIWRS